MVASIESHPQNALAKLRTWNLRRDDTSDEGGRLYWDAEGNKYFSVTRILAETSPPEQKKRLRPRRMHLKQVEILADRCF